MKTAAINPAIAAVTNTSAKATQPDTPFDQVLSREVANRHTASDLNTSAGAKDSTPAPQTNTTSATNGKTPEQNSADEGQTASSGEETAAAVADNKNKPAVADEKASDKSDEEVTLDAASAELLAMVASLNPMVTPQSRQAATSDDQTAEGIVIDTQAKSGQTADLGADIATDALSADTDTVTDQTGVLPPATDSPAELATDTKTVVTSGIVMSHAVSARSSAAPALQGVAKPVATDHSTQKIESHLASDFLAKTGKTVQGDTDKDTRASSSPIKNEAPMPDVASAKSQSAQPATSATPSANTYADAHEAAVAAAPATIAAMAMPSPVQQAPQAAAAAANNLLPYVGNPEWNQALGQKVVWMVSNSQQTASLTLNPPDLGPLQVVVSVTNNHATANFTAAQPEVRQALENAMPRLREMLGDAGIQLGQANVNAGTPNNQQNGFSQHASDRQSSHSGNRGQTGDTIDASVAQVGRSEAAKSGQGLVDTFV